MHLGQTFLASERKCLPCPARRVLRQTQRAYYRCRAFAIPRRFHCHRFSQMCVGQRRDAGVTTIAKSGFRCRVRKEPKASFRRTSETKNTVRVSAQSEALNHNCRRILDILLFSGLFHENLQVIHESSFRKSAAEADSVPRGVEGPIISASP